MSLLMLELVGICALSGAFVLRYGTSRPWWKTHAGRALVTAMLGLTLLSGAFIAQTWVVVSDPVFEAIAAVIFIGALLTMLLLVVDDVHRWRIRHGSRR